MANLDKLLRKIEKNKETENEVKTYPLEIAGETFEVKTMTRKERRDFIYAQDASSGKIKPEEMVNKMKPFIYRALNLAPLAEKAKEEGHIKSYYDVIEALFEPTEIFEIIAFIIKINNITGEEPVEELEEIKK